MYCRMFKLGLEGNCSFWRSRVLSVSFWMLDIHLHWASSFVQYIGSRWQAEGSCPWWDHAVQWIFLKCVQIWDILKLAYIMKHVPLQICSSVYFVFYNFSCSDKTSSPENYAEQSKPPHSQAEIHSMRGRKERWYPHTRMWFIMAWGVKP